ncbi:hypothetical protein BSL82_05835 [Tardibacter chloracetimidivorans]|uniref:HTH cro/C1-type domain-containing protein n=1 Tax=Tardibacter chloracetimidivorans TaxID=1921510 RepID=A0A1L3ZTH0_9SPHN|nr:helix-turn-helix transcriptional regulator [Tardibacter chloracetimidivorans]API58890.1 hypothetical protein BSL82_05835 [Tardibacter chloracetimidivorans]
MKAARKRRNLSQQRLAELLGREQPTIQRWEAGKSAPKTLPMFVQLCDALGVSADALLGRQPVPSADYLLKIIDEAMIGRRALPAADRRTIADALCKRLRRSAGLPE